MTKDEAMKLALEWFQCFQDKSMSRNNAEALADEVIDALREALAEPSAQQQQEPVAAECKFDREKEWGRCSIEHHNLVQSDPHKWPGYQTRLLYTSPPAQRTWVGLTDEEVWDLWNSYTEEPFPEWFVDFKRSYKVLESKLKELNT